MTSKLQMLAIGLAALLGATGASGQDNIVKLGISAYTTHSHTNGVIGVGVPEGADAQTGNATTLLLVFERKLGPNLGAELALGLPPRIKAKATGSVAFLGDEVLTSKFVAPTFFLNYHFGQDGDTWRPYVGGGVNFTRFINIRSKLAPDVALGDSTGLAAQAGIDFALNRRWSVFASLAALQVKSKLVASGATVLQSTIDFRPIVYSFGTAYHF
ncbi:MAG: OmpW family protein [Ideonella sp.]|jgi:outer membrane protein|nr:OmpW family protein [Ideonella sp.]MBL0147422.1 OmpW family protein [Ideonella sp.]